MTKHSKQTPIIAKWQDVPNDGTLNTFAKLNSLSPQALRLSKNEAIILPNNRTLTKLPGDNHLFAPTAKDIMAVMKDGGISARLYDDNKEKRELILKSADIIIPILFLLGDATTQVALGVLASWIYDRWIKNDVKSPPAIKAEYVEINQGGTITRWRKIEGPAPEVQRLLSEESKILAGQGSVNKEESFKELQEKAEVKYWDTQSKESVQDALDSAHSLIQEAKDAVNKGERQVAEALFRSSLVKIREALLLDPEEKAHSKYLHDVGRCIHDIFGCQLEFRDSSYMVTCPVLLSHSKGGFSIGGSGKAICSICGRDVLDCSHLKGHIYNNVVAKRHYDICNICGKSECGHKEGEKYNGARAFAFIVEMDIDHISLVSNPANPLCVIQSYSVSKSELLEILPEDERGRFVYGETAIHCHHCLVCNGASKRGGAPLT